MLTNARFTRFIEQLTEYAVKMMFNQLPAADSHVVSGGIQRDKVGGWLTKTAWDHVSSTLLEPSTGQLLTDIVSCRAASGRRLGGFDIHHSDHPSKLYYARDE